MKFPGAIKFWIYLEYEVEMNQGFIGVCAREGVEERGSWREKRGASVFWFFEFGHDWRETGGVDLYSYFFGPLIQAFSFAYKEKKYPAENLFLLAP